ncbi:SAM-dependent DNA methyltransferase [Caballeronia sp. LZ062]|uniref:Eco57I restriction-modification methylase domain-containing protein n=1 Tax=unclassified Caballeronia TaxID=2646786 RepID=UPI002862510F|nr:MULTISPECIES: DNA methyltransferase [unclassified Caballeronia]MDR5853252.1 SAM-dependent DNA methyltransferase [Caballeronia sp. LZ050]MDR5872214.1 SAM-dependent DNA methyltransferase [Caballeronia sp. LZ062]
MMQALDKDLRSALEKTVKVARTVAETAAHAAVDQLGVGHDKPEAFLSDAEKALRNRLRTHGKQLGDARDSNSTNPTYGKQEVQHLLQEVAYQHWHRMLFARFLADNDLLMFDGVAVTLDECEELASDESAKNGWELAGKLAARMLPQIFKPGSPVFELTFAPEHQSELERLLKDLPDEVFKASDSLGWVYQFWQADNKERINKSEVKIGADELPAVTQLFTEPYMVAYLLDNSLGAWWATRHPGKPCPVDLNYFRTLEDGTPAAGKFEGWPDALADFKLLDPCCGSGHFLVAAFLMLVPMRMATEGLSPKEAVNRVLAENIHGLELDPRCVEIAVFAVALEAWRYPDASGKALGVREIPAPNIACCGLKVASKAQDWEALVPDDAPDAEYVRQELRHLHASFSDAPLLGSLLDPARSLKTDLATSSHETLMALLRKALATERSAHPLGDDSDLWELALSAQGLLEAARLLDSRFHLVVTNVPYLGRRDQGDRLKSFCQTYYDDAKSDLANVFLERCTELCSPHGNGVVQIVMPQNWLFLGSYARMRTRFLENFHWLNLAVLGDKAFRTPLGVAPILFSVRDGNKDQGIFSAISTNEQKTADEKSIALKTEPLICLKTKTQLSNPDARISFHEITGGVPLSTVAECYQGVITGDKDRFFRFHWEVSEFAGNWDKLSTTNNGNSVFGGMEEIIFWQSGVGELHKYARETRHKLHDMHESGNRAWGRNGVRVNPQGDLRASPYFGEKFDGSVSVIVPKNKDHALAIMAFCESSAFSEAVRKLDRKRNVTNATFLKVPFDLAYWQEVATSSYPKGSPKLYSDDHAQWIFHGHPRPSTNPLQVAIARLVGYTWPAESDDRLDLSDEARAWVARAKTLRRHADKDGIVCIPPVGREAAAADRLLNLLADAYGDTWSNDVLAQLLTSADHAGKSLETWLRDKFFTQHCALFGNRPFVWHVWDGLRDGFAALVNYHKLDYKTLEALTYTYLGDWIGRQKRDAENGVDGAQEKLAAAEVLKKRLELILAGEEPYDIFVRWKSIEEQPVGWTPDLNDGVRVNIRPFLSVPDVGKRGAGVLRDKPKSLHWEKDRGSDVSSAPWYELGIRYGGKVGDRVNDHHLALAEKNAARAKQRKA